MLCCRPGRTPASWKELCWVPVPAPNPFTCFGPWWFFMYDDSEQELEKDFSSPVEELGVFPSQSSQKPIRQGVLLGGGKEK